MTAAVLVVGGSLVAGWWLGVAAAAGLATGLVVGLGLVRLRGQLDGDVLGATVELGMVAILTWIAVAARWPVL
jgi:hypothetical protein